VSTSSKRATMIVAGLMALTPATALGATKSVGMGPPPKTIPQNLGGDVNDFFPHGITIHVGDSVKFNSYGFHTVEIPKKGAAPLAFAGPTGSKVSENDPAGAPYWFNGLDVIGFNPAIVTVSNFGKKLSYNGSKSVESGLATGDKPKPMTVKFKKTGKFTYYCNIHPGMKGTVKVVAKPKKVPSAKKDKATVKAQVKRSIKELTALGKTVVPAGTVVVGPSGPHGSTLYSFAPAAPTVPVGTTLKYVMPTGSSELHTATAGPDNPEAPAPTGYLGTLAASLNSPNLDPAVVYPSDQPGAPPSLTHKSHGIGFWNTGFLDGVNASPLPAEGSVTFAEAGKYDIYCLIHPFMHQVVTVTG
jgi:plastocyanin